MIFRRKQNMKTVEKIIKSKKAEQLDKLFKSLKKQNITFDFFSHMPTY